MENKYKMVYSDIKKDILFNHYRAGSRMPTQAELCNKYDISRMTLIKVLRQLQHEGLVYSKQGSGTYVRPKLSHKNVELLPLTNPIGTTYSHRDQTIKTTVLDFNAHLPENDEMELLEIPKSQPIYDFHRLRQINDEYYSLEHTIMPTNIVPIDQDIAKGSIYDYLGLHKVFITDARRIVYATAADKYIAKHLHVPLNEPIFTIEQIAYDQKGRAFEHSTSYFIGKNSRFLVDVHL